MNNDFLGTYNILNNDNLVNVNTNIIDEDPINQVNMSLDQLLTNLKSDKAITNDNFEGNKYITIEDGQYLTLSNGAQIKA